MMTIIRTQNNFLTHLLFVIAVVGVPVYPLVAGNAEQSVEVKNVSNSAEPNGKALLYEQLGQLSLSASVKNIIQHNELRELQIDWLVRSIDNCSTALGSWALQRLIEQPIANKDVLQERQSLIKIIADDERLHNSVHKDLTKLAHYQPSLLMHLTHTNPVLRKGSDSLFYALPWGVGDYLNESRIALDGVMLYEMSRSTYALLALMGLRGIQKGSWAMMNNNAPFAPVSWLMDGLKEPLSNLDPRPEATQNWVPGGNRPTFKDYVGALFGTLGDRCRAFANGYEHRVRVPLPFGLQNPFADQQGTVDIGMRQTPHLVAVPAGLAWSAIYYFFLITNIRYSYYHLKSTNSKMEELHAFMISVAQCMRTIQHIAHSVIIHDQLQNTNLGLLFKKLFNEQNYSDDLKKLFALFDTDTFNQSSISSLVYSRGRILLAYKLLDKVMPEILPMLRAVGMFDAYSSLAARVKDNNNRWNFVEFVDNNTPLLMIDNFKTPVFEQVVSNSIAFGYADRPTKLLITGPNMSGKSVIIRLMLAQSVVLAQSIGVVPADALQMTMVDGLFTAIDPQEDMKNGISTFGAETIAMDRLYRLMEQFEPTKHYMLLIDEPYTGTVNDETARLTGLFLEHVTNKTNVIVTIATHILPQVTRDKQDQFGHSHVEIKEPTPGNFVQAFKLRDGCDHMWLNDRDYRRRYVGWLGKHMGGKTKKAMQPIVA